MKGFKYDADGSLAIGEKAPDFLLPGVDGKTYHLYSRKGAARAFVVIFSCNHCPYVIKWEDRMIALGKEFIPQGVDFYLISVNDAVKYPQDSFPEMKRRAEMKGYPFPYLYDESQESARDYGAKVTPHVFLFDGDLTLRYRGLIDDNPDHPGEVKRHYLREALGLILQGLADRIEPTSTNPRGCSIKWK